MKKLAHIFLVGGFLLLFIPHIALAAWWNPGSWSLWHRIFSSENNTSINAPVTTEIVSTNTPEVVDKSSENLSKASVSVKTPKVPLSIKSDTVMCNGEEWNKCPSGQNMVCPAKGDAYCATAVIATPKKSNIPAEITVAKTEEIKPVQVSAESVVVEQKDTPYAYDKYSKQSIVSFSKHPSDFVGWGTQILVASVVDFLAVGDRGGTANYIEISDANDTSVVPAKMMIQFDNDEEYRRAIYSLNKNDLIDVWGIGIPSQKFSTIANTNSSSYEPVIRAQRIDKCNAKGNCGMGFTVVAFLKNQ